MDSIDNAWSAPSPSTTHRQRSAHTELHRSNIFSRQSPETIPRLPIPYHRPRLFLHSDRARRTSRLAVRPLSLCPAHRLPFPRLITSPHTGESAHRSSWSDNQVPSPPHNVPPGSQLPS